MVKKSVKRISFGFVFIPITFVLFLSLTSCNKGNALIVTADFWWKINNVNNVIIKDLRDRLKKNNGLFVDVNRFDVREVKNWVDLQALFKEGGRGGEKSYGYYVLDPVVSKWIVLYEIGKGWRDSAFLSFIKKNSGSKFVFLAGEINEKLFDFDNVVQVFMEEKTVFGNAARIVSDLLKENAIIRKLYASGDVSSVGIIYYTPDGEKSSRIVAFDNAFTKEGGVCLQKRLGNIENRIKAKLALEELRDKGAKIFLFDAYSLNPYLISLAEKDGLIYIVNYMKRTSFPHLLFSVDYDYAKLIGDSLLWDNDLKSNGNSKVAKRANGKSRNILRETALIWWGNYIKIPERYKYNGIVRN